MLAFVVSEPNQILATKQSTRLAMYTPTTTVKARRRTLRDALCSHKYEAKTPSVETPSASRSTCG